MASILSVAVVAVSLSLLAVQIIKYFQSGAESFAAFGTMVVVLGSSTILLLCDTVAGGSSGIRILTDLYVTVLILFFISSTFIDQSESRFIAKVLVGLELGLSLFYLLCVFDILPVPDEKVYLCFITLVASAVMVQFVVALGMRIYDVKKLMKTSNVWTSVNQSLETFHIIIPTIFFMAYMCICVVTSEISGWHLCMMVVVLLSEVTVQTVRISSDISFVIMRRHERLIIESMKISNVELSSVEPVEYEHKELYDRLVAYFEAQQPYLKNDLTINEVANCVFSNRLYVARAISHYTGRNFCQFVNYYRIMHSVRLFREQPGMRVNELATACGFNTMVSFATAFRLFMNETPSDWCRKEKSRITKKKK